MNDVWLVACTLGPVAAILAYTVAYVIGMKRAGKALRRHLQPGEAMVGVGTVRRKFGFWATLRPEPTRLLITAKDGACFLQGRRATERWAVTGVLKELEPSGLYRDAREFVGLMSQTGIVYFWPFELPPTRAGQPRKMPQEHMPAHVLRQLLGSHLLEVYASCPLCHSLRPETEADCSNPACVAAIAAEEAALAEMVPPSPEPALARASCVTGGCGGALLGAVLQGVAYGLASLPRPPHASREWLGEYWWAGPIAIGLLGYLLLYFISVQRAKATGQISE